jgi:hypothetical protein
MDSQIDLERLKSLINTLPESEGCDCDQCQAIRYLKQIIKESQ